MDFLPFLCFTVFIIGLIVGVVLFVTRSLQIVPEGTVAVVERSGEFQRVLNPGRHFLMPLDRIRALVELKEFTDIVHADTVITQNATVIGLDMDVSYRIARYVPQKVTRDQHNRMQPVAVIQWNRIQVRERDVFNAVYNVDNWQEKTKREATAIMHDYFSVINLARDIFGNDGGAIKRIASSIRDMVNDETAKYGVEVTNVKIYNLTLDEATRMFLTAQKRAEMQNALRLQEAKNQREIRDTLHLDNDQLLRWFEIETRKEKPIAPEANIFVGEEGFNTSLLPTTGPFSTRQYSPPGGGGNGGNAGGGGNRQ
ncbi:MAG TPA: SPFH domain-containing protein [Chloroflexia bacterium]|nr:SPFH domain-containing protein [Chloroflexia bacterium]